LHIIKELKYKYVKLATRKIGIVFKLWNQNITVCSYDALLFLKYKIGILAVWDVWAAIQSCGKLQIAAVYRTYRIG